MTTRYHPCINNPLVPDDFDVPTRLETERFHLRMLTIHDVVKDYDAMMGRVDPDRSLTLEQNLIDLGWHQKEFQRRSSFTYTVMNPDESQCLGCIYIYPPPRPDGAHGNADAHVYLWVRQSEFEKGLDAVLFRAVKRWIEERWCFTRVEFPGRDQVSGALHD